MLYGEFPSRRACRPPQNSSHYKSPTRGQFCSTNVLPAGVLTGSEFFRASGIKTILQILERNEHSIAELIDIAKKAGT